MLLVLVLLLVLLCASQFVCNQCACVFVYLFVVVWVAKVYVQIK
jgi:hypothetical protein